MENHVQPSLSEQGRYYVLINNENFGPYSRHELVQYVSEKKILRKDPAWTEGLTEWVTVEDILDQRELNKHDQESTEIKMLPTEIEDSHKRRTKLSKLTAETIRQTTKKGEIPLHRAARNGTFEEIPRELLTIDLFLLADQNGRTALHVAALYQHLNQIPPEFLTPETMTVRDKNGFTPLHSAAANGCFGQVPPHLLTPDLLAISDGNSLGNSVVHLAAMNNQLSAIPDEHLTYEILNQKNLEGQTPLELMENNRATERQVKYLRDLGANVDETTLTKSQASDLIDELVSNRRSISPPSEAQVQKLTRLGLLEKLPKNASMEDASELIDSVLDGPPTKAQISKARESGFIIKGIRQLTARELDDLFNMEFRQPEEEVLEYLRAYGVRLRDGNGLCAQLLLALAEEYNELNRDNEDWEKEQIPRACALALSDPTFKTPTLSCDGNCGGLKISWPKAKLKEWLQG